MLAALAAALGAALLLAPSALAASTPGGGFADQHSLIEAVRAAFVGYWGSGERGYSPGLERVVDYWFRYHLAKAVIAAMLLAVLVALAVLIWRGYLRGRALMRASGSVAAAVAVTLLGLFTLLVVMANLQGAVAPLSSVLTLLPVGARDGRLAEAVGQARNDLVGYPRAGFRTPPAVQVMVSDFGRYHAAMAVIASVVAAALIGVSAVLWRRFAAARGTDRRALRVSGAYAVLSGVLALALLVIVAANVTTAADPAPELLAFFQGGW